MRKKILYVNLNKRPYHLPKFIMSAPSPSSRAGPKTFFFRLHNIFFKQIQLLMRKKCLMLITIRLTSKRVKEITEPIRQYC